MTAPEDRLAEYLKLVQRFREEAEKLGVKVTIGAEISVTLPEPAPIRAEVKPSAPPPPVVPPKQFKTIQTAVEKLQLRYPLHTAQHIATMIEDEMQKAAGLITFEAAAEIVDKLLDAEYQVEKKVKPQMDLSSEIKTAIDGMGFDVTRFDVEDLPDKVTVKSKAYMQQGWAELNDLIKNTFKGGWVKEAKESRWVVPKK